MFAGIHQTGGLSKGDLAETPVVEILGYAYAQKKTGRLSLKRGRLRKEIFFLNGLPAYVTSTVPAENLLEVIVQFRKLSPEDAAQLQILQKEKGFHPEQTLTSLGILSSQELYYFQIETYSQMVIHSCGWNEGSYRFSEGESYVTNLSVFDLNPLELIYQGLKQYHSFDLAQELKQIQDHKVRLIHGWEQALALPEAYYFHSDVLDLFEQEISLGESVPKVYEDLRDLNETLIFIYLLLVTGLLEVIPDSGQEPSGRETKTPEPEPVTIPRPAPAAETVYFSTDRQRETVAPAPAPIRPAETSLRQSAEAMNRKAEVEAARAQFNQLESELQDPAGHFERLGVDLRTSLPEIEQALHRRMARASLEGMPAELQAELAERQQAIQSRLEESCQVLTEPERRMAYEQGLFTKELTRAWEVPSKQKLAERQWNRGQWYLAVNRPEFARRYFQQALELDPREPLYYAYTGWACYRNAPDKDLTEARDYLDHALQIHSTHDQAHYFLGVIAKRGGNEDQALYHFSKALEANPSHAQAHRELDLIQKHSKQGGILGRMFTSSSPRK